jgi:NAD(P)-dependent dehydrogenase (short-subunit alcohol dehydrogenase family)
VLGQLTPLAHLDPKTFQEVLEVNVTANWRLIRSLDPLLRQSDAGRVLFVTSGAARRHTPYWGGYAVSKAALESLALTYAAECETTAIKVNLINPGPMRTAMRKNAMPGEDPATLPAPEDIAYKVVEMLSPGYDRNETIINFQRGLA